MSRAPLHHWLLAPLVLFGAAVSGGVHAQDAILVAPPRSIADITAILDSEKPDHVRFSQQIAAAGAEPPQAAEPAALYDFYISRAQARTVVSDRTGAQADAERAMAIARSHLDFRKVGIAFNLMALQYLTAGEHTAALRLLVPFEAELVAHQLGSRLFAVDRWIVHSSVGAGDLARAEDYVRRLEALLVKSKQWKDVDLFTASFAAEVERARATLAAARGRFNDAELAYSRASAHLREAIKKVPLWPNGIRDQIPIYEDRIDLEISYMGLAKAAQGRLSEAETDVRRALLGRLRARGKYSLNTANIIRGLATVVSMQGRHVEAEKLARVELDIRRSLGADTHSESFVIALKRLTTLLLLQDKRREAAEVDAEIDDSVRSWVPERRDVHVLDTPRVFSLLHSAPAETALAAAQKVATREAAKGDRHPDAALARGLLAVALVRSGREAEAMAEFEHAVPLLIDATQALDLDESAVPALRTAVVRFILEGYVGLLARVPEDVRGEAAEEAFSIVEAVRGRAVRQAVGQSAARVLASDEGLAELVRREQDYDKGIAGHLGLVNNLLAKPRGERDDGVLGKLGGAIDELRGARDAARAEIASQFPRYAELIDPKPPTVEVVRETLRQDEALVSFYFGREQSFVWALPKVGPLAFAVIPAGAKAIDASIAHLREALEPDDSSPDATPQFDLAGASDLYELLLKPVEAGWRSARSLIVVTNGALGLLPLGLLPTERIAVDQSQMPAFTHYRKVAWLARTHAVTQVPSAATLRTLRQLPPGSAAREPLIGFGDPYFNEEQAQEANTVKTAAARPSRAARRRAGPRGGGVDSAELARLARLPDTADELRAIAGALRVDPARTLYLGKAANELAVKGADLGRYRTVAFATHGLMPGDLKGLTQPALALTAPKVAGIEGNGLLTMEEVMALRLDADWVILSACNTGAGTSVGAEALSGLGRAFFYAGARALLITNWSVDSDSARELVADIFDRQAHDPSLSRSEALRQAMMQLVDAGGYSEDGRIQYSYAHPLFWAPYSLVGEGGN
jgi:CHAT domain-containing protein